MGKIKFVGIISVVGLLISGCSTQPQKQSNYDACIEGLALMTDMGNQISAAYKDEDLNFPSFEEEMVALGDEIKSLNADEADLQASFDALADEYLEAVALLQEYRNSNTASEKKSVGKKLTAASGQVENKSSNVMEACVKFIGNNK